jgi:hypothetical protein
MGFRESITRTLETSGVGSLISGGSGRAPAPAADQEPTEALFGDPNRLMFHDEPGGCGLPIDQCRCGPGTYGRRDPERRGKLR